MILCELYWEIESRFGETLVDNDGMDKIIIYLEDKLEANQYTYIM